MAKAKKMTVADLAKQVEVLSRQVVDLEGKLDALQQTPPASPVPVVAQEVAQPAVEVDLTPEIHEAIQQAAFREVRKIAPNIEAIDGV